MDFLPFYTLFSILLIVLWMWREDRKSFRNERKDFEQERQTLLDRIMAKNYSEYKVEQVPEDLPPVPDQNIVDLEDAKEELLADYPEESEE